MIEQLKTDRTAQVMLAGVVLAGCFACVIFGVAGYLILSPTPPPPAQVASLPEPTSAELVAVNTPIPADTLVQPVNLLPSDTPLPTPTSTRVVAATGTPTSTPVPIVLPTLTPKTEGAVETSSTPDPALPSSSHQNVTKWQRYEATKNNLSVNYPVTVEQVLEDEGTVSYQAGEVRLPEGTIKFPIVTLWLHDKNAAYLPDADLSDPVAMLKALTDVFFLSIEDQLQEMEPLQAAAIKGYSGAKMVTHRVGENHAGVPVDVVYYFALFLYEDQIIDVRVQARMHNGGELVPVYAAKVIDSLEMR